MHHFFVKTNQVNEDSIVIEGSDVNHIKNVLRIKVGEDIKISDGHGHTRICAVVSIESDCVRAIIKEKLQKHTELASKIYLFQGLPKGDKMELIIQKAVELGAYEIIPVKANRCIVKLDDKKALKKVERWQGISESGAKQSGRGIIPNIQMPMTYQQAISYASQLDVLLIPYEGAEGMEYTRQVISQIQKGQSVGIFIGPEGGFEAEEIEAMAELKAHVITLGNRILRTETAGLAALSILMYHLED